MTYKVLELPRRAKDLVVVNCGNCPVNLACAIDKGGNGHVFSCCGSTGVYRDAVLLMIDCNRHRFENDNDLDGVDCPLCSNDVLKGALLNVGTPQLWVPTVHACVPAEKRLEAWRTALPKAREYAESIKRRKGKG